MLISTKIWLLITNSSLLLLLHDNKPYFSGLNPSNSSRKMLLLVTVLSWFGIMRNLRMVPLLDPRKRTVWFLCGPASVSTTILFSWYLNHRRETECCFNATEWSSPFGTFHLWKLKALSRNSRRPVYDLSALKQIG